MKLVKNSLGLLIFFNYKTALFAVFIYYFLSSLIYAVLAIARYNRYPLIAGDLCIFNQGIWQYSQLKWPIITFHLDKPFLADHFHPILITLAPFYRIFSGEKTLLFLQPFILLSAMFPIFLISRRLTKSNLLGLVLIFCYSFYIPIQYTIFFEFHEIIFLPPLLAWAYWFLINNNKFLVAIFLLLILFIKEELGFLVASFGLYLTIFIKKWRMFGLLWFVFGIAYSLVIIYFIIPAIGGKEYGYLHYGASGRTPIDVILNIFKSPFNYIQLLYNDPVKQETLFRTFWPFGFLPILSPLSGILSLEQFASRFFDLNTTNRWTIHYHYSVPMAIIMVLGVIEAVSFLIQRFGKYSKRLILSICIILIVLTRFEQINASAVLLAKRPEFWKKEQWMQDLDEALLKIDNKSSVTGQQNIVCRVSNREKVYFWKDRKDMDYIILKANQNQLKDYLTFDDLSLTYHLIEEKNIIPYKKIFQKGEVNLFQKLIN